MRREVKLGDRIALVPPEPKCEIVYGTIIGISLRSYCIKWDLRVEGCPDVTRLSRMRFDRMYNHGLKHIPVG